MQMTDYIILKSDYNSHYEFVLNIYGSGRKCLWNTMPYITHLNDYDKMDNDGWF